MDYQNEEEYYKQLRRIQEEHLKKVAQLNNQFKPPFRPCMHDQCQECHGTGIKYNGQTCIHMISCPCPKCTPYCSCDTRTSCCVGN